jgi:chemotaxis methyl-accepting protein methylase
MHSDDYEDNVITNNEEWDEYVNHLDDIETVAIAAAALSAIGERKSSFVRERQRWEDVATSLLDENSIRQYY